MVEKLKAAVWQIVTEPNNKTVCPVRLMSIFGFAQFSAMAWFHLHKSGMFDVQAYALSYGALLGGIGAALGLKKDSQ
jgi:hypothetical protein